MNTHNRILAMTAILDFLKEEWMIVAAACAALIIVLITVVVCAKKKKSKRVTQAVKEPQPAPSVREATPVIAEESEPTVPVAEAEQTEETKQGEAQHDLPEDLHLVAHNEPTVATAQEIAVAVEESDDAEVLRGIESGTGLAIVARYKKSFLAKLIQASQETKEYYSALKNAILSYKKTTSRVSWNYDSINSGRTQLAKFSVRGKTLNVYLALAPEQFEDSKYKVTAESAAKYENVPCRYKITNARRLTYALELIAMLAEKFSLQAGKEHNENYVYPYESTEALIERELIKELISKEDYEEFIRRRSQKEIDRKHREFVSAAEVNAIISDEVAISVVEDKRTEEEKRYVGKKGIINIDVLSRNFQAGDVVNLQSLKEKGLIDSSVGYVKVLARGTLNKPLTVDLQNYSIEAVKMIVLTGGKVDRV